MARCGFFVNFFHLSFKLADKTREGAKVKKRYHPPATPHQQLLAGPRTAEDVRRRVEVIHSGLDLVQLLQAIWVAQQRLVDIADRRITDASPPAAPTLEHFLSGLRTSWQEGEVRPIARPNEKAR